MDFTRKIFKSIQQDEAISGPEKSLKFCQHIEKVETIFIQMLKARVTLNVHSMSALLAMMQQKGYKSMNEFVPTADEVICNRY